MADISAVSGISKAAEFNRVDDSGERAVQNPDEKKPGTPGDAKDKFTPSEKTEDSNTTSYPKIINKKETEKQPKDFVSGKKELTDPEKREVENLKKIDNETRSHEAAHIASGGNLVRGGASYSYQKGPDGKSYAVGGEVQIDISPEEKPDDTIQKMDRVRRAAMAPADPSSQDRQVAAKAAQIQAQARSEKMKQPGQADDNSGNKTETSVKNIESDEQTSAKSQLNSELITNTYKKNESVVQPTLGEVIDFSINETSIQKLDSEI